MSIELKEGEIEELLALAYHAGEALHEGQSHLMVFVPYREGIKRIGINHKGKKYYGQVLNQVKGGYMSVAFKISDLAKILTPMNIEIPTANPSRFTH